MRPTKGGSIGTKQSTQRAIDHAGYGLPDRGAGKAPVRQSAELQMLRPKDNV